ncbi:MAG TPA: fucose isomerase, partial [Atribacterota bacterium]|nr:fucose isomerase [Atribacterota bacterium]
GLMAGCEGDVPSLISMILLHNLTNEPIFLANPVCIDEEKNEITFAHCTIPLNMCESYKLESHFESGMGVAVRGKVEKGPVTIFKLDGNAEKYYLAEGEIVDNLNSPDMCRTQLKISLKIPVHDFLEKSIANHQLICKGWHGPLLEQFFSYLT